MIRSQSTRNKSFFVHRIVPVVFLAATLALTPAVPAFASGKVYSGSPISLDLVDADLQQLLTSFSEITDLVFAVDAPTVEMGGLDRPLTVNYKSIPWDQALDEILTTSGLSWTLEGKVLWIHLPDSEPKGDRNFTGDAINLRLEDARLTDVLGSLAKITGLGIDFDPDIEISISVALRGIPWDQVLDLILRISGYDYTQQGKGIGIFRVHDSMGLQLIPSSALEVDGIGG